MGELWRRGGCGAERHGSGDRRGLLILWVGAGGVVGAMARYLVVGWVNGGLGGSGFPYGTLAVNAVGCFLIGLIVGFAEAHKPLSSEVQAFLIIGVLGGLRRSRRSGWIRSGCSETTPTSPVQLTCYSRSRLG